ncbi:hypothetical protein K439DRAFT_238288 [Ramaria rubella]|nr:hypothetical protein K439DRAFT_238288 [Ramaria rubella]
MHRQDPTEVIDVEEFYENLEHKKSSNELKRECQKLKEENKELEIKINNVRRASDVLSEMHFKQEQRRNTLARLLGFQDANSAEASITSEDPWIPGGQAALEATRTRILLLEDELGKHMTTSEEAQTVLADTKEILTQTQESLTEALEEAERLREQRDMARKEAERQAMEARKWRLELQAIMPELQSLVREIQQNNKVHVLSRSPNEHEKENIVPNTSPSHGSATATSPTIVSSSPSSLVVTPDTQCYKLKYELLEKQYKALLASKAKISRIFREQILKWKKFKTWLVKDDGHRANNPNARRRILRRKKIIEEIGPQIDPRELGLGEDIMLVAQESPTDADTTLVDTTNKDPKFNEVDAADVFQDSRNTPSRFAAGLVIDDFLAPSPNSPILGESLTQPSSLPVSDYPNHPAATHLDTARPLNPMNTNGVPFSQQSLTQPSSPSSCGPSQPHMGVLHAAKYPDVIVLNGSPERDVAKAKHEELPEQLDTDTEEQSDFQGIRISKLP